MSGSWAPYDVLLITRVNVTTKLLSTSTHSGRQCKELPVTKLILNKAYLKNNNKAMKTTCDPGSQHPSVMPQKDIWSLSIKDKGSKDGLRRIEGKKMCLNALPFILKSCIKMTCLSFINFINSLIIKIPVWVGLPGKKHTSKCR